jgi:hypothetical protein
MSFSELEHVLGPEEEKSATRMKARLEEHWQHKDIVTKSRHVEALA